MDEPRFCAERCGARSGMPWCEHEWERIVYEALDAAGNEGDPWAGLGNAGDPWPDEDCHEDLDARRDEAGL